MTSHQIHGCDRASLLSILSDPFICISFSQFGEDTLILEYLSGKKFVKRSNFFVDIGAYHPSRFSNTKLLSLLGWTGINVDPNPDSISLFEKARPKDINLNVGVTAKGGTSNLYRFSEGAVNTFDRETAEKYIQEGWVFIGNHPIETLNINDLLEKNLPESVMQAGIGFLDIDCEGLDAEIVEMLDIPRFNPLIIAVESHGFDPLNPMDNRICRRVLPHGYVIAAYLGPTLLFWKKDPDL